MKNYIVSCLAFAGCFVFSQNVEVKYYENESVSEKELEQRRPDSKNIYLPNTFSYTLMCNSEASLYKNDNFDDDFYTRKGIKKKYYVHDEKVVEKDEKGNEVISMGTMVDNTILLKNKERLYYKNIPNNSIFAELNRGKFSYHIVDKRFDFNWEITDETKELLGYTCRKATSNFMGDDYVAWYTEDIPINSGPESFDGLPGLILHIALGKSEIIAYSIRFLDNSTPINQPVFKGKTYTFSELFDGSAQKEKRKETEKQKKTDPLLYKEKTIVHEQ